MEYELLDTGIFDEDRYFDVEVTYAKAGPARPALPHRRAQPRARGRADPSVADDVVPQHVDVPAAHRDADDRAGRGPSGGPRRARRAGRDAPLRGRGRRAAVLRQRVQRRPPLGRRGLAAVPEGRHRRPRAARHADRQPRWQRDQGGRPSPPRRAGRRFGGDVGAPDHGRPGRVDRPVRRRRRGRRRPGAPTPTSSTRRSPRPGSATTPRRCSAKRSPGCCGRSSRTTSTSTCGCRSTTRTRCAIRSAGACATRRGST